MRTSARGKAYARHREPLLPEQESVAGVDDRRLADVPPDPLVGGLGSHAHPGRLGRSSRSVKGHDFGPMRSSSASTASRRDTLMTRGVRLAPSDVDEVQRPATELADVCRRVDELPARIPIALHLAGDQTPGRVHHPTAVGVEEPSQERTWMSLDNACVATPRARSGARACDPVRAGGRGTASGCQDTVVMTHPGTMPACAGALLGFTAIISSLSRWLSSA